MESTDLKRNRKFNGGNNLTLPTVLQEPGTGSDVAASKYEGRSMRHGWTEEVDHKSRMWMWLSAGCFL
jgi:hypothetical protein